MYIMYKNNISLGKTVAITLVRTFLTILILALAIPFAFMFLPDLPKLGVDMKAFIYYIVIFSVVALAGVIVSLVRPKIIKRLFGKIVIGLKRIGFVRPERVIRMLKRVLREIDIYHKNVWAFITTGRKFFLLGSLAAIVQLCVQLSVMPCMIWALGMPVAYVECVLVQALFIFMLYFIPTPGGSGAAELGAAFVFNIFVPWNLAGMLGVVWRVLTEYTGIVLGGIVALKLIGWDLANQIMTEQKQSVDEADSEECSKSENSDL